MNNKTELNKFFTGKICSCGGEVWSDNYGYSCKKCNKSHIVCPETHLHINEEEKQIFKNKKEESKLNNWTLNSKHKMYGKVVMCRLIEGEPYRFFDKDGSISMIPLSVLQIGEIIKNENKKLHKKQRSDTDYKAIK